MAQLGVNGRHELLRRQYSSGSHVTHRVSLRPATGLRLHIRPWSSPCVPHAAIAAAAPCYDASTHAAIAGATRRPLARGHRIRRGLAQAGCTKSPTSLPSAPVAGALQDGAVVVDRSHWGRISISGEGRALFMHNQSTNDFKRLQPGQGCDTVFVTSTARTLDLATALLRDSDILVVVSPGMAEHLVQRFDKYIFPADKVKVKDVTSCSGMVSLMGPKADALLAEAFQDAARIIGHPRGAHKQLHHPTIGPVTVVVGSGLGASGYTLITEDPTAAGALLSQLAAKGCEVMGEQDWELARVRAGRPAVGSELTQDFNPLEAGLYHAVSVTKGCYIGQETLAKLSNLDGVKQQLWGLELSQPAEMGASIDSGGARIGRVTSVASTPEGRHLALGYLRCKSKGVQVKLEGITVSVSGSPATVTAIPFASRALASEQQGQGGASGLGKTAASFSEAAEEARRRKEEKAAAEAAAKEERLKAMQARLAAWQSQQAGGRTS